LSDCIIGAGNDNVVGHPCDVGRFANSRPGEMISDMVAGARGMIPIEFIELLLHDLHDVASGTSNDNINLCEACHNFDFFFRRAL
jgi:hypothetical protein